MAFAPAQNTSAFLKSGILGFQGSGKTKTAAKIAIGLSHHLKRLGVTRALTPVYMIDSETGSDWVMPDFEAANVPFNVWKTRAFANLVEAVKIAEKEQAILLCDSATHFWTELCTSYCRQKARRLNRDFYRLQLNDWGYLKGPDGWGKFADLYVNSRAHIVLAGRAGYEFDTSEDEDGNKQLEKTGVKMKAEGEFGFEPSLLVYMERHQRMKGDEVEEVWREATILKDRAGVIDGASFKNPDFKDFLPHIQRLNLGGPHIGVDGASTPDGLVAVEKKDRTPIQRQIVIDEINDLLLRHDASGTSKEAQKRRSELIERHFGTVSKTKIEETMSLFDLRAGYDSLHQDLEGAPSRYSQPAPAPEPEAIDDALPDCCAPAPAEAIAEPEEVAPPTAEPEPIAEPAPQQSRPDDGIPDFLRRQAPKPPADVIDEKAWLDRLAVTFKTVGDFDGFKREHERLIRPQHERVSPAAWSAAVSIAQDALHRVTGVLAA